MRFLVHWKEEGMLEEFLGIFALFTGMRARGDREKDRVERDDGMLMRGREILLWRRR